MTTVTSAYRDRFGRDPADAYDEWLRTPGAETMRYVVQRRVRVAGHCHDDLLQEIKLQVWKKYYLQATLPDHAYTAEGEPQPAYLTTLCKNVIISSWRKDQRQPQTVPDGEEVLRRRSDLASESNPEAAALACEAIRRVAGEDPQLARDMNILKLHDLDGYSYIHIARMLYPDEVGQTPSKTLRDRVTAQARAARKRLQVFLDGNDI